MEKLGQLFRRSRCKTPSVNQLLTPSLSTWQMEHQHACLSPTIHSLVVLLQIKKSALADTHQQWRFVSLFFNQINFPMSLGNLQPTLLPSNYITSSTIKHCAISVPFIHNWTVKLQKNFNVCKNF